MNHTSWHGTEIKFLVKISSETLSKLHIIIIIKIIVDDRFFAEFPLRFADANDYVSTKHNNYVFWEYDIII